VGLRVELGDRGYDILIEPGALSRTGSAIRERLGTTPTACIADERVASLHWPCLEDSLRRAGLKARLMTFRPGERSKTLGTARRLLSELADLRIPRDGTVVSLGGGVAGDLAGFVAAVYQRGIAFVQVPTSLLAQVDASVGGKTGVNLPEGKNLVGAFHQPRLVVCDPLVLRTCGKRDLRCGLSEALKHGFILSEGYLSIVEQGLRASLAGDPDALAEVVRGSCAIKADVVRRDEREEGLRAILNFGHTFGHAVENVAGYRVYRHGEAVAVGMVAACHLSERLGLCSAAVRERLVADLRSTGLPVAAPGLAADRLLQAMWHDKKILKGRLRLVLPRAVGRVEVVDDVSLRDVRAALSLLTGAGKRPDSERSR